MYNPFFITDTEKDQWTTLVKSNPNSGFMQSFEWADFLKTQNWEVFKVGIKNSKDILQGGMFAYKFKYSDSNFIYVPDGPVLDSLTESNAINQFEILFREFHFIADSNTSHIRFEANYEAVPVFYQNLQKNWRSVRY